MQSSCFVLDPIKFQRAMERAGFQSVQQLALRLGIHRNTIQHFLSGASVFPNSITKILDLLRVEPNEIIGRSQREYGIETVKDLVDAMLDMKNDMCVVLFGSRARGTQKRFSDFDLGVYAKNGIDHQQYLSLLACKEERSENLPVFVDLVNLNRADKNFMAGIVAEMCFIGGRLSDWLTLKGGVDGQEVRSSD